MLLIYDASTTRNGRKEIGQRGISFSPYSTLNDTRKTMEDLWYEFTAGMPNIIQFIISDGRSEPIDLENAEIQ